MSQLPGPVGLQHEPDALRESIWRAPLMVIALIFTLGMGLDRFGRVPNGFSLLLGAIALVAFVVVQIGGTRQLGSVYLALAGLAFGASYHHYRQELFPRDELGRSASDTPEPVRLRGIVEEEPRRLPGRQDIFRSQPTLPTASTILRVSHRFDPGGEIPVSGRVRLVVSGERLPLLANVHPGDEIEVRGRLSRFAPRASPGEFDFAAYWHDRGVHALLSVREGDAAIRRLRGGEWFSPVRWIGVVRGLAHDSLDRAVHDPMLASLARALLLGEGAPLTPDEWSKYVRTGVVHVLAISGQHLVIVAMFLWFAARLLGVRQRSTALLVAFVLLGYALLTGSRPPALRAAVGACVICLGLVIRRPAVPANLLALAWIIVGLIRPADLLESGCQLSFVSVAILCWGVGWLFQPAEPDPLQLLIERARPAWQRGLLQVGRFIARSYAICFVVWIAISPLAAFHTGILAPTALLLGPPLTLLASIALLAGFLVLLLPGGLAAIPAWVLSTSLRLSDGLVVAAESWSLHLWIGTVPIWWVGILYVGLLAVLTHRFLRERWRWAAPLGTAWVCVALAIGAAPRPINEVRCTFLPVGHGGATVIELPDGRTLLYDAGSLRGPDVTARTIAPFLWSRGIHHLDDVILSHADLDHFNGLVELADRFAIGRVLTSDTFAERAGEAVEWTRSKLRHLRWEVIAAGDRLASEQVTLSVLHPPREFREGNQNARSLVLELRHGSHRVLLTGDLEGEGLSLLLRRPPRSVDILMAPHHGSQRLDVPALVRWCDPGLVVSSQGTPRGSRPAGSSYLVQGVEFWSTHQQGAITLRLSRSGIEAEAYHGKRHWRRER